MVLGLEAADIQRPSIMGKLDICYVKFLKNNSSRFLFRRLAFVICFIYESPFVQEVPPT